MTDQLKKFETCATCRFLVRDKHFVGEHRMDDVLMCHRYPSHSNKSGYRGTHTTEDYWCGEYQPVLGATPMTPASGDVGALLDNIKKLERKVSELDDIIEDLKQNDEHDYLAGVYYDY